MTSTNVRAMFELGATRRLNPWRKCTLARTFDVLAKCDLPLQPPQNRAPNGAVRGVWSYQLEHEHPYIGRVNVRVARVANPRLEVRSRTVARIEQASSHPSS